MKKDHAYQLINESYDTVKKMGLGNVNAVLSGESILLGIGSPLDSIGFVTFLTDLEERIINETKRDLYLVLNDIVAFNINKPQLSADALAQYIVKISEG